MPRNYYEDSQEDIRSSCLPAYTSCPSEDGKAIPQNPTSFPTLLKALHNTARPNPGPRTLACPVSGCPLVFKGQMPHGYLWRHLKRPGVRGRTDDEKATWENLHKIQHDRLLATRVTPAERRREANKAKAEKMLRVAEFELRARNLGFTEKALITQKVAIWEGIYAAEQRGDGIGVSIPYPILFWTLLWN
ncbi:hypothetical protein B9Z19DRAFT_1061060 [Tuber borchii]|uniref:Uncharacterized protein n=1 Tax=Tuber borchii TaxID=42251 RepID=A0A2T7A6M4_TUBBO|nr:hypothetical protein B9Z19DRAFT_1061060 [Tuber borchii]